jgi:hypothetical protein
MKYIIIYYRFKLKLVKGQLARDKILLDNFSAPFYPILLSLKIWKVKIIKPKKYLNIFWIP